MAWYQNDQNQKSFFLLLVLLFIHLDYFGESWQKYHIWLDFDTSLQNLWIRGAGGSQLLCVRRAMRSSDYTEALL